MKNRPLSSLLLTPVLLSLARVSVHAETIINIDFLEQRGSESAATNYTGTGAAGGSDFNGLTADDNVPTTPMTIISL